MTTIVKVSHMPTSLSDVPSVVPGDPVQGDPVRVTTASGVSYERYTPQAPASQPRLNQADQRRAMVLGRARELDKKGKHQEASALRATLGE